MKNILILILFIFSNSVLSQNIAKINSDLRLSDTLKYDTEVRIYHNISITNYSTLFRMFKDKSGKWNALFYEHFAEVPRKTKLKITQKTLESKNDLEYIFQNFVRSHILDLPNQNEIDWKLVTRGKVEKVKSFIRGKEFEEYELNTGKVVINDGEGYKIQVKGWNKTNEFELSNPYSYLNHYPEIDELIYYCEILNLVREEFGIWRD